MPKQQSTRSSGSLPSRILAASVALVMGGACTTSHKPATTHNDNPDAAQNTASHHAGHVREDAGNAMSTVGDRRIPYTPSGDAEFVAFFIAHHQAALHMAEEEVRRGVNDDVKQLAQAMLDMQRAEVAEMEAVQAGLQDTVAAMPIDAHGEADMSYMASVDQEVIDRVFLVEMIAHHAAALAPAHRALPYLQAHELLQIAGEMPSVQAREIGQMHELLHTLGGTGAGEDHAVPGPSERADFDIVGDRRVPLTPKSDEEFIDFFVPHHEMAIMMAEHVVEHGSDPSVIAMAENMRTVQSQEVAQMRAKREALTGAADSPAMPSDPHTSEEMELMMDARGAELDRMFLIEMAVHHSSAIPTAHRAKPHVKDEALRLLADRMFLTQAAEIGDIQAMLDQ